MTFSLPKLAVAATVVFACGVPSAFAAQAVSSVNVRSGPGTNYGIVSHMSSGQYAELGRQSGSWCYVVKNGPDGWVSCRYLADDERRNRDSRYSGSPDVSLSFSFGTVRDRDDRPNRPRRGGWNDDGRYDGPRRGDRDWDRNDRDGRDNWFGMNFGN
jgi:uncharacterized protein YraI